MLNQFKFITGIVPVPLPYENYKEKCGHKTKYVPYVTYDCRKHFFESIAYLENRMIFQKYHSRCHNKKAKIKIIVLVKYLYGTAPYRTNDNSTIIPVDILS